MLWFIGYLKKVMEPKKKGPQRAVINGSLWPIVVFWLSREGYGTKKKGATDNSYKLLSVAPYCGF